MVNLVVSIIAALSFLFTSNSQSIEQAFLQNSPKMLYSLLSTQSNINISLPPPLSFSDQLSNQQTYFLFKQILSSYSTSGFFSNPQPALTTDDSFIIEARWSFKDNKGKMDVFLVFFYFVYETNETKDGINKEWRISEIRAERDFG